MDKAPARFELDHWYKVLMLVGAAGVAGALVFEFHGVDNLHAQLLSLGVFLVGMGEWINHPLRTAVFQETRYDPIHVVTGHPREPKRLGTLFDLLGALLIGVAIYKIAQAS